MVVVYKRKEKLLRNVKGKDTGNNILLCPQDHLEEHPGQGLQ